MQYVQGAIIKCGFCGRDSVDLMEVQQIHRGHTWKMVWNFVLERRQGSARPVLELFSLTGRIQGLGPAQAEIGQGLP
jgi:hypothetical protein